MEQILDLKLEKDVSRRDALKLGLAGAIVGCVPLIGINDAEARGRNNAWRISIKHAHTDEVFRGTYRVGNRYIPDAFAKINRVLRDFRTGEVFPMDPRLIDILSMVQRRSGSSQPFEILSGYRSPKTNSNLRKTSSGVAKNSFHMYGQALDIQNKSLGARRIRDLAINLKAGGVGYYPRSDFVHIDTGTVRSWNS